MKKEIVTTVITYNGEEHPRHKTKKIDNNYYLIGDRNVKNSGHCYDIDGTYYRSTTGRLEWNDYDNCYDLKKNLVYGYMDNGFVGNFRPDVSKMFFSTNDRVIQNEKAIEVHKLKYDFSNGCYVEQNKVMFSEPNLEGRFKPSYKSLRTDIYNSSDYPEETVQIIKENMKKTFDQTPKSVFDKYFFNYNIGQEIETDGGWLPEKYYYKYGCLPLKDGSIRGIEITTLVQKPSFNVWKDLYTLLSKYTRCTSNNSLHINVSGFENTPKFRVALYNLYYRIQQELLQFIPLYKRDLNYFLNKLGGAKDHCKPLEALGVVKRYNSDNIDDLVNESDKLIFTMLNEGHYDIMYNLKTRKHIKEGHPKWEWKNRYYSLNFIPLYFGPEETARVEFRLHQGTVNPIKALVWIFICTAIVKYTEKNVNKILTGHAKITLEDILQECYVDGTSEGNFLFEYIVNYISQMRLQNINDVINSGTDLFKQFKNDHTFNFAINNISILNYEEYESKKKRS